MLMARHGLVLYDQRDPSVGRALDRYGEYSEGEVELFRQLLRPGQTVVEADANLGALTLPIAKLVGPRGKVHAFEPQRLAFQTLVANMTLNGQTHVHCHQQALSEQASSGPGTTLDAWQFAACHFLKLNVKGMEQTVLEGAKQTLQTHRPFLYVKNEFPEKSPSLIEFLQSQGYRLYWHAHQLYSPSNYFSNPHNELSDTRSINLLGIPSHVQAQIQGLREVTGPESQP